MRKFYDEFFHISKNGKIREKVMLMRTAFTVVIMVICLFAMSFTAYAYFSHNVTSGSNVIKAANFEAIIAIDGPDDEAPELKKVDGKTYAADLKANTKYTMSLKPGGTAETGFCVITAAGCDQTYHTQQLGVDLSVEGQRTPEIKFSLIVSEDTTVYVLSHWGTSSHYEAFANRGTAGELYITNGNDSENPVKLTIRSTPISSGIPDESGEVPDENKGSDETTTPTEPEQKVEKHIVQSGETLSSIAAKYGWSYKALAAYNGIDDPNKIKAGQTIDIPPEGWTIPETTTPEDITTPPETTNPEGTEPTEPNTTPEGSKPTDSGESSETTGDVQEDETQPTEESTGESDT